MLIMDLPTDDDFEANKHLPKNICYSQFYLQASIVQENLVALKASRGRKSDYVSANLEPLSFSKSQSFTQ